MIIVRMFGGLGNQLFQYALYKKLKKSVETYADVSAFENKMESRMFGIGDLGLGVDKANPYDVFKMSHHGYGLIEKIGNHIPRPKAYINEEELGTYIFHSEILEKNNAYLEGYWQCVDYFTDIRDEIRDSIHFKIPNRSDLNDIIKEILDTESVSIHMRFGDYLDFDDIYGGICTADYYMNAIRYMKAKLPNASFFLFSDDCKKGMELLERMGITVRVVDINKGSDSYIDMYLMTICKHNIIANSSFSFWGAYLNENKGGIVICPERWINSKEKHSMKIGDWIEISKGNNEN